MKYWGLAFIITGLLTVYSLPAHAQFCENGGTIDHPILGAGADSSTGVTSALGPRDRNICPYCSAMHRGTDYGHSGQPITIPEGCEYVESLCDGCNGDSGWGHYIRFDCGTTDDGRPIRLQYAHLANGSYDPGSRTITPGGSGAGGPHLDFIMTIDGVLVDAQCAAGTVNPATHEYGASQANNARIPCPIAGNPDLCDPEVADALIEHGQAVMNGDANFGINPATGATPPNPPDGSTGGGTTGGGTTGGGTTGGGTTGGGTGFTGGGGYQDEYDREPGDQREPYVPPPEEAVCSTSTCITPITVNTAEHTYVQFEEIETRIEETSAEECLPPISTGAVVFRQVVGETETYPDKFCLNKGCNYEREETCQ